MYSIISTLWLLQTRHSKLHVCNRTRKYTLSQFKKLHFNTRFGNFEKKKALTIIHITSVLDPYIARGSPAPLRGSTAHQRVHTDVAIKGTC